MTKNKESVIRNIVYPVVTGVLTVFLIWVASQIIDLKICQTVLKAEVSVIKENSVYMRGKLDKLTEDCAKTNKKNPRVEITDLL